MMILDMPQKCGSPAQNCKVIRLSTLRSFQEIDKLRRDAGLSRVAVCKEAGLDRDTYWRNERQITSPNEKTLKALSDALDALMGQRP